MAKLPLLARSVDRCKCCLWCSPQFELLLKGLRLSPDRFEIVVRGVLSPSLIASIDGFDARYCTDGHTHLVGVVPDQSTFNRLLQSLLEMDVELVSVNPVGDE